MCIIARTFSPFFLSSIEQEEEEEEEDSSRFLSVCSKKKFQRDIIDRTKRVLEPPIPDKQTSLYFKHLERLSRKKGEASKIGEGRENEISPSTFQHLVRERNAEGERGMKALREGAMFRRWWNVTRQTDILPRHLLPLFLLLFSVPSMRALFTRNGEFN